jgi:Cu+-exporting ATPase
MVEEKIPTQAGNSWKESCRAWPEALRKEGQTVMLIAVDGKAAGLVGVSDPIKQSTPEAIRKLKAAGLQIIMVTGDNATTAQAVANKLGIAFEADVLPEKKAEVVRAHRSSPWPATV